MDNTNLNKTLYIDAILSKIKQLDAQHKFLWIQGASDNEISHLLKKVYDQLKQKQI